MQMRHFPFKCVLICLDLCSLRWQQDSRFEWCERSWNVGLILMGELTPGWAAAPGRCVHRWQQRAAASTAHCHTHSHSRPRPAGTARSPQSRLCSTEGKYIRIQSVRGIDWEGRCKYIRIHRQQRVGERDIYALLCMELIHKVICACGPSPLLCRHWGKSRGFMKSSLWKTTLLNLWQNVFRAKQEGREGFWEMLKYVFQGPDKLNTGR